MVNDKPNVDGKDNYVILEATGRGHYVGVTHSILQNQGDWWGEGDEMIYIDGEQMPGITGTGSEDYYLGAWCYGGCAINPFGYALPTFDFQRYGNPVNGGDDRGAKWMVYRLHTESPIAFTEGHQGHDRARPRQSPLRQLLHRGLLVPDRAASPVPRLAGRRRPLAARLRDRRSDQRKTLSAEKESIR